MANGLLAWRVPKLPHGVRWAQKEARKHLRDALVFARAANKRARGCMDEIRWLSEGKARASTAAFMARAAGPTSWTLARRAFRVRDKIGDRFEVAVLRCVVRGQRVSPGKGW